MTEENTHIVRENLSVSDQACSYLAQTGKWSKFLGIIGFILTALIITLGIFFGSIMSLMPMAQNDAMPDGMGSWISILYVLMGALYFMPSWYLYTFSKKISLALEEDNEVELEHALKNQKSFFKFWGITTIVMLCLYPIMIIGMFIFGLVA